jgi:hypothetical protein
MVTEFEIPVQLHLDGPRELVQAHISRVNAGFLVLSSPMAIEVGRNLNVFYLQRRIPCETAYCQTQPGGKYRIGVRMLEDTDIALRAERRIRWDASAQLHTPGLASPLSVRVIDISSSGLGIKLDVQVTTGVPGYVELTHGVAFGEIRHCEKFEGGYRAGIFVEEFISRVPGVFTPWAAHGMDLAGRNVVSSVARALRTALNADKRF